MGTNMRIIAGSRKSLKLKTPSGMNTRPTMDRTKETLFNILSPDIYGCRFLDLFSGSGSIGLEALSRGADYAVFVEKNKAAADIITDNIKTVGLKEQSRLMNMDIMKAVSILEAEQDRFDIIFLDPPFEKGLEKAVIIRLSTSSLLHKDTMIVTEASVNTDFKYIEDYKLVITKEKSYKTHKHIFICLNK